ncbi:MAG TPA: transglutaminase family protein, partial [Terrimicrobiaceae bacterium]|nr:transglutaminase family protein [Terrimicrobiaceae bacterium]
MDQAAARAEAIFKKRGVQLTLGGEPTYVPINPEGAEWNYAAVGPTKLAYAWKVAQNLLDSRLAESAPFFCPGKSYPGEVNPRWVVRILANRDGTPLFRRAKQSSLLGPEVVQRFADGVCEGLGVARHWLRFADPVAPDSQVLAMPIDFEDGSWRSSRWGIAKALRVLSEADGPAGLRLPLHRLPPSVPRRAISIEIKGVTIAIFIPPLLQKPFIELLAAIEDSAAKNGVRQVALQGYTPADEAGNWIILGLTADPGVLEVNLPACSSWHEYAEWIEIVTASCEAAGLRSWKESSWDLPQGTGGGNHLLWGGSKLETNPF